ncbi:ATP-binding cassette sub-family B member 6 [Pseudolycoriella hygida]|uniref:ATP-binding cassette sub-family B member 6 n=1 Tax=Pseudolycoriella hygida TaxID=35572 RepID=A0A9Q0NA15_9DIPT|nr:ATP-binding cassette sub-family B member 6 [Pseudolycoriella hygida]
MEVDENKPFRPSFTTLLQNIQLNSSPVLTLIKPLLWPKNRSGLRILIVLSLISMVISCSVNMFVPIYAQKIVDSLTPFSVQNGIDQITLNFRWDLILIFTLLKLCQGVGGLSLITCIQQILWIPLANYVKHEIQVKFFQHLHKLSLRWLIKAKTGEILGALERGTEGMSSTMEHLLYSVAPTIADILIAMTFFTWKFGWIYGAIVATQISLYFAITVILIERRCEHQSSMNLVENQLKQSVLESLLNFETVKCFGNEEFEKEKYSNSLKRLHHREYLMGLATAGLQMKQLFFLFSGMMACTLLLVSSIIEGTENNDPNRWTAGDYVLCTSYLAQLYGPLNYLAGYYKNLRVDLINVESMLEYLNEKPEIFDSTEAIELQSKEKEASSLEFRNVSYVGDTGEFVLKNISFSLRPNMKVALVGHTGSGKTSVIRLLMRVIEASSGDVFVDGNNIKEVTLKSLRKSISIVPQDTNLFNDTIRNNIKYGQQGASNYEVALAATSAQIHDRIMSFPFDYETVVGERGTRLSGGERQRIAISRAIVRDPRILILDEATSALDSKTERQIQEALNSLCKNRTCLMITHRLAPVVDADLIIVLKEGQIVEEGTHSFLMGQKGVYAAMWGQQHQENKIND